MIVDGADNFPTRYLVNDASVWHKIPVVHGSIYRFEGQATVFKPFEGPCYRCLFPQPPPPELAPSCAEGGVLGVLPGIDRLDPGERGAQAGARDRRAARSAGCCSSTRSTRRSPRSRSSRDPDCPVCGEHPTITEYIDYVEFCAGRSDDVTVRIPPTLRTETGGEREVPAKGATVARGARRPARAAPRARRSGSTTTAGSRAFVNVYVDGEDVRTLAGPRHRGRATARP